MRREQNRTEQSRDSGLHPESVTGALQEKQRKRERERERERWRERERERKERESKQEEEGGMPGSQVPRLVLLSRGRGPLVKHKVGTQVSNRPLSRKIAGFDPDQSPRPLHSHAKNSQKLCKFKSVKFARNLAVFVHDRVSDSDQFLLQNRYIRDGFDVSQCTSGPATHAYESQMQ